MERKKFNRIAVVMAEKEKTSNELAEKLGLSRFTVSKWRKNQNQPTIKSLYDIADALGVSAKDLLAD